MIPELLRRVPDGAFRIAGLVFFLAVVAWRVTKFGSYDIGLWAAETSVYVLIVLAYLGRTKALERPKTLSEIVLPLIGGPLPFALLLLPENPVDTKLAFTLMLVGACTSVVSYVFLGNSFAILVEARELRSGGPYRWIRHPVYLGQIVATAGVVLYHFAALEVAIWVIFVGVQIARALLEERKLERATPGYAEYKARTWMFLPFVV